MYPNRVSPHETFRIDNKNLRPVHLSDSQIAMNSPIVQALVLLSLSQPQPS